MNEKLMKKRGRKTLCNAATTKKVCAVLEKAQSITSACAIAGIGTSSYHSWVAKGEAGEGEYVEFAVSCGRARAKAKQKLTDIILKAAPDDWRAASWLMEKLFPNDYGRDVTEPIPSGLPPLPEIEFPTDNLGKLLDALPPLCNS